MSDLRLTLDVLERMATHVRYEYERMGLWTTRALQPDWLSEELAEDDRARLVDAFGQATLKCGLLHLRVVVDFLSRDRPGPKDHQRALDVVAADYFEGGWARQPATLLSSSGDVSEHRTQADELHRRLAHISQHRLDDESSEGGFVWQGFLERHVPVVGAAVTSFLEDLERLHPERYAWFRPS